MANKNDTNSGDSSSNFNQRLKEKIIAGCESLEKKLGKEKAGILYFALSNMIFFIPSAFIRNSNFRPQWYSFIFWRGFVGVLLSHFHLSLSDNTAHVKDPRKFRLVIFRNVLACTNQIYFYFQFQYLPLSEILILVNSLPICTYILSFLVYKVKPHAKEIFGLLVAFIGILIVVGQNQRIQSSDHVYAQGFLRTFLLTTFLLSHFLLAFAFLIMRHTNLNELSIHHISYYLSIIFLLVSLGYSIIWDKPLNEGFAFKDYLVSFFIVGVLNFVCNMLAFRAMFISNPSKLSICNYLQIFFSFVFEIIMYNEIPGLWQIIGVFFLIGGVARSIF